VYYASDYVEYKVCDTLVKRIERKNRYLILLFKGEKAKAKGCYKGQKSKAAAKKDSLLNRKRCLFKRRLSSNTQNK
jgi:hypothetical protein